MAITSKMVQELREKTGVGMMDCKRALEEAGGDMEEAVKVLRKKGMATAEKKSARAASEGRVTSYVAPGSKVGALVEINCETDFVANTDDFLELSSSLSRQVAENAPAGPEALLDQPYILDGASKVRDAIVGKVAKLGENIQFRRFVRYEGDRVATYIHAGGKIGVLMQLALEDGASDTEEAAKDLCMQVAASAPRFVSRQEVTASVLDGEREIYRSQVLAQGKPESIVDKIVDGKMNKFYEENCLLEQAFIKDTAVRVQDYLKSKTGGKMKVVRFERFVLGEGLKPSACGD
ncbi:MAG: translation elongation factor Ts [Acidobacteriota bacterium]